MIARNPFAAWVGVGVLLGLSLLALLLLLPVALAAVVVVVRRTREPDDALGALAGFGLVLLLVNSPGARLTGVAAVVLALALHWLIGRLASRG